MLMEPERRATETNDKQVAIMSLEYFDEETVMNATEYIFLETIELTLYIRKDDNRRGEGQKKKPKIKNVKKVKSKVDPEKSGVDIEELRRKRGGDRLLSLDECKEATKLKQEIEKANTRCQGNKNTLHVIDLDAVTTVEDTNAEIKKLPKRSKK